MLFFAMDQFRKIARCGTISIRAARKDQSEPQPDAEQLEFPERTRVNLNKSTSAPHVGATRNQISSTQVQLLKLTEAMKLQVQI